LLDHESVAPITNRTAERWPAADTLVSYLQDYVAVQEEAGAVRYNTKVLTIKPTAPASAPASAPQSASSFVVTVQTGDSSDISTQQYGCTNVVVATGLAKPNIPTNIEGIELVSHIIGTGCFV
jgi:cation diffusion facilitator CzcD-associated flavoprotein CzcO